MIDIGQLWKIRQAVRNKTPLVYSITNTVVTNFTANVLLAAGAAPIMSEGQQEAEELVKIVDVIVLNIGTLHTRQVDYFLAAGHAANRQGKPVVFDPVGVGATSYRNQVASQIIQEVKPTLIRGNYGEIGFLGGITGGSKGVDSLSNQLDIQGIKGLATRSGSLIVATGAVDYVTDGKGLLTNCTGHIYLQAVTGTGCALTALTGAFIAVAPERMLGVLAALAFYGAAAEKAAVGSRGPGSFAVAFLDALYNLDETEFREILTRKQPSSL